MQHSPPQKTLFLAIAFLALSSVIFLFLYNYANNNREILKEIQTEFQVEEQRQNEIKSLDQLLKTTIEDRLKLNTHFVKSSDAVSFLDEIEKLATRASAKAQVVSVDIAKDNPVLLIEMKAKGNFEAIYRFITLLENSPYELEFVSVDIQTQTESEQSQLNEKSVALGWIAVLKIKLLSLIE